jgi:DNA-binding LacI/PurR family transcriptional regulator
MAALEEAGLEVPGDAAFISCENSDLARSIKPGLTALSLERESAAALACKLMELLEQGRAGKRSPLGMKIPLALEERGSTGEEEGDFSHRWL